MKRPSTITVLALLAVSGMAQVHLDHPLVLTSNDSAQRTVEGLAPAAEGSSLIDLKGAQVGRYHWAAAGGTGMSITLAMDPPCVAYRSGLDVRFMPISQGYGAVTVDLDGLGARRIYRSDGLSVSIGQLQPGTVVRLIYSDTAFFLGDRAVEGCPNGFLPVNGSYCIQRNDTVNTSIFTAVKWCNDRGARLCSWGEYIYACTVNMNAMEGMFDDWEWIDDTSDHTHTAVQAGRWECRTERSASAVEDPNVYARTRCCYTLR